MSRVPEGMLDEAQKILSRTHQIGAMTDVDEWKTRVMSELELDEMVNHRLAVSLVPYLVEMASRREAVVRQEHRQPGALVVTFRADVVVMSADDYSHLCNLVRRMRQLNAETDKPVGFEHMDKPG